MSAQSQRIRVGHGIISIAGTGMPCRATLDLEIAGKPGQDHHADLVAGVSAECEGQVAAALLTVSRYRPRGVGA